jgi:methionine sulfoxide reductase heme-binding subunit
MGWLRRHGAFTVINVLALLPLLWIGVDAWLGNLSAEPLTEVQDRTGLTAIVLLMVSLAGTPLYWLLGFEWLRQLRRLAGLYAFGYTALHLVNLVWLDYEFNLTFLYEDVLVKRFIIAGLAAFLLLLPVVFTSTRGWRERLGRGWRRLHYLVYPAALLAAVHFIWQAKIDIRLPLLFTAVIALLLFVRLPFIRGLIDRSRRSRIEPA